MVDGIQGSSLARAALEAALRSQQAARTRVDTQVAQNFDAIDLAPSDAQRAPAFDRSLVEDLKGVNAAANKLDELPVEMVTGKIHDFHELAVAIKQSELTFRFAMEVRNKLIDAYRETMRMSV